MPPIPPPCQSLVDEIESLKQQRSDLQAQLQAASPGHKGPLVAGIRNLSTLINAKQPQLDACVVQHGGPPPPQPLAASLIGGTARLTTDRSLPGEPFVVPGILWGLLFDGPRYIVAITAFPEWAFDTTPVANTLGPAAMLFDPNITRVRQLGLAH